MKVQLVSEPQEGSMKSNKVKWLGHNAEMPECI